MDHREILSHWSNRLATQIPSLSRPQVKTLARWSFAAVVCAACGLEAVSFFLAQLLGENQGNLKQRLRDVYRSREEKVGTQRAELALRPFSQQLLDWILRDTKKVVLVLDPTTLGSRFTVLTLSVVCLGGAIPVAWHVTKGNEPGAWNPLWFDLLNRFSQTFGPETQVLVLTDRGLESPDLFREIQRLGFIPVMRVKIAAKFRPEGWKQFHSLASLGRYGGFASAGVLYKARSRLNCVLLIHQEQGYEEPWLLATSSQEVQAVWYCFRCWIEKGFRDIKRGGLQWQRTQVNSSQRVERYWCVVALSFVLMLEQEGVEGLLAPQGKRKLSAARIGQLLLLISLLKGQAQKRQPVARWWENMEFPNSPKPPEYTEHDFENS